MLCNINGLTDRTAPLGGQEVLLLFCEELIDILFGSPHGHEGSRLHSYHCGVFVIESSLLKELGYLSSFHFNN
jgi:hypothetical protein